MEKEDYKTIKIKKIQKAGFFGLTAFPKSVTTLCCEISKTGYKTGLSSDEEKHYEAELSLKPGELGKHSKWWGDVFNVEHTIRLNNTKSNELILDNPINQLKYKVLLSSSKVANTEIEKTPNCEFYIVDDEARAEKEVEVFNFKFEAFKLIMGLSPEDKRGALRLFGKSGIDTMSETMLNSQLGSEMEKDPKKFIDILTDKSLKTKMLIQELVEKNLLKRKGNYYIHGDDTIANSTEECVDFFDNPKNQSVRLTLVSRLKKEKK
jgi:hypothetical protein